ncbi:hypothetical protein T552_02117 [Pneumocystis carinii B80]|uniref:Vacuolar protein sorting-associated protein 51 homolog n=1 Tax=Pneumocystis carinii (strain B80) TaxID=1408658 RepID=A0A0W4ZH42_PNEC8|nr:hypothetical protein T552_02117 [Pneumocystis carinii B80]KTW27677.1 hypothetical protein T552_02117 [Pneumocystis carinii B80]
MAQEDKTIMNAYKGTSEELSKNNQIKRTLREFYKLDTPVQFETQLPELDKDNFNLEEYIKEAESNDPDKLLKLENTLIKEIRNLESEKKVLIYDNYTKLLSISDIIQKMKNGADSVKPIIDMLEPTLENIGTLSESLNQPPKKEDTKN